MQTTEKYTRVNPSVKLEALESVVAHKLRSGRFKASDRLTHRCQQQGLLSCCIIDGWNAKIYREFF